MEFDVRMDAKPVVRFFAPTGNRSFQAALLRNYRDLLPEIADKLIATIRAGDWFTSESGNLKKKMYRSGVRVTKQSASIDVGWSGDAAIYGPVLETGPKVRSWKIEPRGLLADSVTVGGGKSSQNKIRALRWVSGGQVRFAKSVTINWTAKSLRPHVAPAMDKIQRWVDRKMNQAIVDADKAAGL